MEGAGPGRVQTSTLDNYLFTSLCGGNSSWEKKAGGERLYVPKNWVLLRV